MADPVANPNSPAAIRSARMWVILYMLVTGLTLILMMLAGLSMRLAQSDWVEVDPALFYQILTVHGTGMVGAASLGGSAVMWYFLQQYVRLNPWALGANLILFVIGVAIILVADFIGGFGGAWTVLYPLPASSQGAWTDWAAQGHLFGLLLVGVGSLIYCLEVARGIIATYGGLTRGLGWHVLFGNSTRNIPPKAVVASTMVAIVDIPALIAAAAIIIMMMINIAFSSVEVNALLAKSLIYFFGHVYINATIYMAVTVVYELLPKITGRPWTTTKPFLASWTLSTTMVLIIFPHHLFMDFAMPQWATLPVQVFSYMNSFPILIVTGLGALTILHRSGVRWDLLTTLLFLSIFGWMAGVIPAVIDATIAANSVLHNTMWVPGHFHFYLLLGLLPMLFGFMIYLARGERVEPSGSQWGGLLYGAFGLGFVLMFLAGGWASVPRRWAAHLPEWMIWDRIAAVMAIGVVVLAALFVAIFVLRLPRILKAR